MADKIIHLVEYSFEYEKAVLILKGLLNEKDISEGIIYKKWGKEPFSVCITDLEIEKIPNEKVKEIAKNNIANIHSGKRDFRF